MKGERPISQVPRPVLALLALTLCLQVGWQALQGQPVARADTLESPPRPPI
jgi:hypothetical protein